MKEIKRINKQIKALYYIKYNLEADIKKNKIKTIFDMNEDGMTLREIGKEVGLSYEGVRLYLKGKIK